MASEGPTPHNHSASVFDSQRNSVVNSNQSRPNSIMRPLSTGNAAAGALGGAAATLAATSAAQAVERFAVVKLDGMLKIPMALVLDSGKGLVTIAKQTGLHALITNATDKPYPISDVLQVIKSRSDLRKIGIRFLGKKRKDYRFETPSARELFCDSLERLRASAVPSLSTSIGQRNSVSVYCATFNMAERECPMDLQRWLHANASPCDIYAIGAQESTGDFKEWVETMRLSVSAYAGEAFDLVAKQSLWNMRLCVLVRETAANRISHVQTSTLGTGIANKLGNKGGCGVSFYFDSTALCFVSCHLASGTEHCARRNADFSELVRGLSLGRRGLDLVSQFHHVFWLGDLNYRSEAPIEDVLEHIKVKNWAKLRELDQLYRERDAGRAFVGFQELPPTFPPTYRYERGTRERYAWRKGYKNGRVRVNQPSWCDRVLWKSFPGLACRCFGYGAADDIMTSDHSPVFAQLQCALQPTYVHDPASVRHDCTVNLHSIRATVQLPASSHSPIYLEFMSLEFLFPRIEGVVRTASVRGVHVPSEDEVIIPMPVYIDTPLPFDVTASDPTDFEEDEEDDDEYFMDPGRPGSVHVKGSFMGDADGEEDSPSATSSSSSLRAQSTRPGTKIMRRLSVFVEPELRTTCDWPGVDCPSLVPVLPSPQFLTHSHIVILVKQEGREEAIASTVISLLPLAGSTTEVPFWGELVRAGVLVGQIEGEWSVYYS